MIYYELIDQNLNEAPEYAILDKNIVESVHKTFPFTSIMDVKELKCTNWAK